MSKDIKNASFKYIGNNKWTSTNVVWTGNELTTLYFVLNEALVNAQSFDERHEIVYLLEKIFRLTETIEINEI